MGWVWQDDESNNVASSPNSDLGEFYGSSNPNDNGERCATRKVVKSQCRTEEVEPGKFIRKCEKTEQIFKDCLGRPSEMVQSNKEYTEEDVTDQMVKGLFRLDSPENGGAHFPGLRSDLEAIERNFFGGISRFFEAAEEMKRDFFGSVGIPRVFDSIFDDDSSSHKKRGVPIEGDRPPKEAIPRKNPDGDIDLSGLARDV